ncbi:hypothetical protein ACVWZG_001117 [Thermostichus sp. OS-CIW-33]
MKPTQRRLTGKSNLEQLTEREGDKATQNPKTTHLGHQVQPLVRRSANLSWNSPTTLRNRSSKTASVWDAIYADPPLQF